MVKTKLLKRILCYAIIFCITLTGSTVQVLATALEKDTVLTQQQSDNDLSSLFDSDDIVEEVISMRDQYSKTFLKADGSYVTAFTKNAIHYEENGEWKEFDNSLEKQGGKLVSDDNPMSVELPVEMSEVSPISISKDGYSLELAPVDVNKTEAEVLASEEQISTFGVQSLNESLSNEEIVQNSISNALSETTVQYDGAIDNAKILYTVSNNVLKEYITLDKVPNREDTKYTFEITADNLTAVKDDTGKIDFVNEKNEVVFTMPAPYMYDSNYVYSFDIVTTLDKSEDKYIITYEPLYDWLSDNERAYPVTIDPTVEAPTGDVVIEDTYTWSSYPTTNYSTVNSIQVGKLSDGQVLNGYMKFSNLPELLDHAIITKATVNVHGLMSAGTKIQINRIVMPKGFSSITYNSAPTCSSDAIDFGTITGGANEFDITSLMNIWYDEPVCNYGIRFTAHPTANTTSMPNVFASSDFANSNHPYIVIEYTTTDGNKNTVNTRQLDIGRAGTVNINDFTGNLNLTRNDIGVVGNIMPVNISMIYNTIADGNSSIPINNTDSYGTGYRTSYSECIKHVEDSQGNKYYIYVDSNGDTVYFDYMETTEYDEDDNEITVYKYMDEDKQTYNISCDLSNPSSYSSVTVTDENGYDHYYDSYGRLVKIVNSDLAIVKDQNVTSTSQDIEQGVISIVYENNNTMQIKNITDGSGRVYKFNYTSGLLNTIQYMGYGTTSVKTVSYKYNGKKLITVIYPDTKTATYEWNSKNLISKAINTDGYSFAFTYSLANKKLWKIQEYGKNGALAEDISISYSVYVTTYTDNNTNDKEILQFDNQGNLLNAQNSDGYTLVNQYAENKSSSHAKNNLVNTTGQKKDAVNMLVDTRGQIGLSAYLWRCVDSNNCKTSSENSYKGKSSFKFTGNSASNYMYQTIDVKSGKKYTFSAYVKTESVTGGISLSAAGTNISVNKSCSKISGTKDWTKIYTTFTAKADQTVTLKASFDNSTGTAYVNALQAEYGTSAKEYNYIENSGFEKGTSMWTTSSVNGSATTAESTKAAYSVSETGTSPAGLGYVTLYGDPRYKNQIHQTLSDIGGKAGDEITFGGWAKADSTPIKDERSFGICVKLYNGGTQVGEDEFIDLNTNITSWQYGSKTISASGDYTMMYIYAVYDYQSNSASFDGLHLYKSPVIEDETDDNTDEPEEETPEENTDVEDSYGRITESIDNKGVKTNTTYDLYNQDVSSIVSKDGQSMTSSSKYTDDGNYFVSQTDALGNTINFDYDAITGMLNKITDANGNSAVYTYDDNNNLTSMSQKVTGLSNGTELKTEYRYDSGDRIDRITHNGFNYNFVYDEFGQLINIKVGTKSLISYTYNSDYELTGNIYGNGQKITYEYDDSGNQVSVYYNGKEKYTYYFDDFGTLTNVYDNLTGYSTEFSLNENDDTVTRVSARYEFGYHEFYTTDEALHDSGTGMGNKVTYFKNETETDTTGIFWTLDDEKYSVYNKINDAFERLSSEEIYTVQRDADGNEIETTKDSILTNKYNYTSPEEGKTSEQVSNIDITSKGGYSNNIKYTYDANGNILTEQTDSYKYTYTYDEAGQLKSYKNSKNPPTFKYIYDEGGNIVSRKVYMGSMMIGEDTFDYDSTWKDLLVEYNGEEITYDSIGNPLSYHDGSTFTWQMGRELASITKDDGTEISYTYNQDGLRQTKTIDGVKTYYTIVDDKITSQYTYSDTDDILYFRYSEDGDLVALEYNDGQYYYVKNLQNDIIGILDSDGNCVVEYGYNPWGDITSITGSMKDTLGNLNPFRYRSYYYDNETGFYYLQSRYYDPTICRFINADSAEMLLLGEINLFAYCSNNPIMHIDPTGHIVASVVGAVIGGVVGLIGGAFLSKWIANKLGLKGWKRKVFIIGLTAIITAAAATIGYFIGPYLAKKAKTIIQGLRGLARSACFIEGTLVLSKDGTVPIEHIKIGDYVFTENPETGEKGLKLVLNTFINQTSELVHLSVNDEIITTTPEHPFYVTNKGWVTATKLEIGDSLLLSNGDNVLIKIITFETLSAPLPVYNLEVEDFHTYYVGENSILVHNTCIKNFIKSPKKYKDVEKLLKKYGFEKIRQNGSHVIFKDVVTGKTFPVPNHGSKTLAIGTLRSILKSAGLL